MAQAGATAEDGLHQLEPSELQHEHQLQQHPVRVHAGEHDILQRARRLLELPVVVRPGLPPEPAELLVRAVSDLRIPAERIFVHAELAREPAVRRADEGARLRHPLEQPQSAAEQGVLDAADALPHSGRELDRDEDRVRQRQSHPERLAGEVRRHVPQVRGEPPSRGEAGLRREDRRADQDGGGEQSDLRDAAPFSELAKVVNKCYYRF